MRRTGSHEQTPTTADKLHKSTVQLGFFELLHEITLSNSDQLLTVIGEAALLLSKKSPEDAILMQNTIARLFVHLGRHEEFIENRYMHFVDKTKCLESDLMKSIKTQA